MDRALNILDRAHIVETHKIGIFYVAPNQTSHTEILGNTSGSPRYAEVFTFQLFCLLICTVFEDDGQTSQTERGVVT